MRFFIYLFPSFAEINSAAKEFENVFNVFSRILGHQDDNLDTLKDQCISSIRTVLDKVFPNKKTQVEGKNTQNNCYILEVSLLNIDFIPPQKEREFISGVRESLKDQANITQYEIQ